MFNFTKKESVKSLRNESAQSSVIGFFIGAMVAVIVALQAFKSNLIKFGVLCGVSYLACRRCGIEHRDNHLKYVLKRTDVGQFDTIIPGVKNSLNYFNLSA